MVKYRIEKIGFSFEVQKWGMINYDGILDYGWKTIARYWSEKEALAHIDQLEKHN